MMKFSFNREASLLILFQIQLYTSLRLLMLDFPLVQRLPNPSMWTFPFFPLVLIHDLDIILSRFLFGKEGITLSEKILYSFFSKNLRSPQKNFEYLTFLAIFLGSGNTPRRFSQQESCVIFKNILINLSVHSC